MEKEDEVEKEEMVEKENIVEKEEVVEVEMENVESGGKDEEGNKLEKKGSV